jgi:hypothetical protein
VFKKYRKFVTSSVGFTFVVVGATGVIFKFFFKNHALEQIHGWLGLAMVVAALFHIMHNWGPIQNYLRDKSILALTVPVITVIIFFGFIQKEETRGVNQKQLIRQLSHANIDDMARVFDKDANIILTAMRNDGLKIENGQVTLQAVAKMNEKSPESLFMYFLTKSQELGNSN